MISAADLPDVLPVFPLPGALLLPRGHLPLNIYEPRYLAMFDDVMKTQERLIGMVQPMDGHGGDRLHAVGCAGRLTSFTETDDGRYMITLRGVSRYRLSTQREGFTPYLRHDVRWEDFAADLKGAQRDPKLDRAAFLTLLARYFHIVDLETDWDSLKAAEDELLINSLSMLCPFAPEDKQALLEAPNLADRRQILVTLMEFSMRSGAGKEVVQ